jgi:histidine triad (HIT) family protein
MSRVLPVHRLYESQWLVAFKHPSPSYPVHILIVPKVELAGIETLGSEDADLLVDLFLSVQILVEKMALVKPGYRLIANGGRYQEIPHLHFHLVSGEPVG